MGNSPKSKYKHKTRMKVVLERNTNAYEQDIFDY